MKTFIGVKKIQAEPAERDGKPGYKVVYPGGYVSWSPADVFEKAYFPLRKEDTLTQADIDQFINSGTVECETIKERCTMTVAVMPTQFLISKSSSCVDKTRYDKEMGRKFCMDHIRKEVWQYLGFLLCWAKYGLKK